MTERLIFEIAAVVLLFGTTTALAFAVSLLCRLTPAVSRLVAQIDDGDEFSVEPDYDPEPAQQHADLPESITRLVAKNGRAA